MKAVRFCRMMAVCVAALALATLSISCGSAGPLPTGPSSTSRADATAGAGSFGQLTTTGVPDLATCLREPSAACLSFATTRQPLRVGASALGAPINLSSSIAGTSVTLVWTAPAGAVSSYVIEAGSSSGSANLASLSTGSALTTFSTTNVPPGTYFVRVRAVDSTLAAGSASNEVVVVVVGGGCVVPGVPSGLTTTTNSGGTVSLTWIAGPGSPTSYILEAGTAPGLSNLASSDVGATTSFTATGVAAGTYYVRVRGRNACGIGAVSIEITVNVTLTISPGRSSMSATIDGVPWTAIPQAIIVVRSGPLVGLPSGTLGISGTNTFTCPQSLLVVTVPRVVGTYAVGPVPLGTPLPLANAALSTSNCFPPALWQAGAFSGSGSITLATLTSNSASGTFSLTLDRLTGTVAPVTKVITNGMFNVTF